MKKVFKIEKMMTMVDYIKGRFQSTGKRLEILRSSEESEFTYTSRIVRKLVLKSNRGRLVACPLRSSHPAHSFVEYNFPLPLMRASCQLLAKNVHLILVNCLWAACPGTE